jgi:hypothetical protein
MYARWVTLRSANPTYNWGEEASLKGDAFKSYLLSLTLSSTKSVEERERSPSQAYLTT